MKNKAEEYLNKIGFYTAHLPELFNDDDKSFYKIEELMEEYANQKQQTKEIDWNEIHEGLKGYCYTMQDDTPSIGGKCIEYLKQKLNK